MKLAQYKYFDDYGKCAWLRLLQFGEGQDERALVDVSFETCSISHDFSIKDFCLLAQLGGDAFLQLSIMLFRINLSFSIWSR